MRDAYVVGDFARSRIGAPEGRVVARCVRKVTLARRLESMRDAYVVGDFAP